MTTHLIDPPTSGVPIVTKCCGKRPDELSVHDSLTWGRNANCGLAETVLVDRRDPECVKAWPGCHTFGYNPACCRFPKSCSAGDFEQMPAGQGMNQTTNHEIRRQS